MIFKDSILLINVSLDKLAKQFNLEVGKLVEPVCRGQGHDEYKDTNLVPIKKVEEVIEFEEWKSKAEAYC